MIIKSSLLMIAAFALSMIYTGCKKNSSSREDYPDMWAYGHTWKWYHITRWETTHPLMSGHGVLVPQTMQYGSRYLENDLVGKLNIDFSLYAVHSKGAILPFPDTQEGRRYVHSWIYNYDNKIYVRSPTQAVLLFSDCGKIYIEGKPELSIDMNKPYEFLGELDLSTKRFILDRVLPVPINSDDKNSEYRKLCKPGKNEIDIDVLVEKSEKYVCE